jgi:benzylsuccinate CoA-transferase BbsF subunit
MKFSELRVLDFCWVGAGAFVTRLLAELGAEVIKIESKMHPDNLRLSGPHKKGAKQLESSGYFASRNTAKKSFALNMSHPDALAYAKKLAAQCSIVTNNFRPGVMERWGLGYDDLMVNNPSLIYLSMPMQGRSGPNASYIGFGSTIASITGLVDMSGLPNRGPVGTGTHYPDHVPNPGHALTALLAAIYYRARTGLGQRIDLAQIESTTNLMGPYLLHLAAGGGVPTRHGNRKSSACPRGVFPCKGDDVWCAIEIDSDEAWKALVSALGSPGWMLKPGLETLIGRRDAADVIEAGLAEATRSWDAAQLVDQLQSRGIASAAVNTSRDVVEDPQLNSRQYWKTIKHAEMGDILTNVLPFFPVDQGRAENPAPPPLLGEHTSEIGERILGLSAAECRDLIEKRVFW